MMKQLRLIYIVLFISIQSYSQVPVSQNGILKGTQIVALSNKADGNANGGGGGDVIIFPLGETRLADTYGKVDIYHDNEIKFSKALKKSVDRVVNLINFYLIDPKDGIVNFLDARYAYYAVSELPDHPTCNKRLKYSGVPSGAYVAQVACSVGTDTWIKLSLFERMSLDDQTALIFHEALRRHENIDDMTIATVVNGMKVALQNVQKQTGPDLIQPLTEGEYLMVRRMFRSLQVAYGASLEKTRQITREYALTRHGGVFKGTSDQLEKLSAGVVIGIGARVRGDSKIAENSVLVETNICLKSCTIGANTMIKTVPLFESIWDESSEGSPRGYFGLNLDSSVNNTNIILIGSDVVMNEARLYLGSKSIRKDNYKRFSFPLSFSMGDRSRLEKLTVLRMRFENKLEIGADTKLTAFIINDTYTDIKIESGTEISNLRISGIESGHQVVFSGVLHGDKYFCRSMDPRRSLPPRKGLEKLLTKEPKDPVKIENLAALDQTCTEFKKMPELENLFFNPK